MDARLIEDDMRIGRQPLLDVAHDAVARDVAAGGRLPERGLVDPIGLALDALADAEGLEHLHRAAGDAVGLAQLQRAGLLLDNAGLDVGKRRKLRGERETRRPAADDEHVDLGRNRLRIGQHAGDGLGSLRSGSPARKLSRWNCTAFAPWASVAY